jgi:CheY-like chemotaxis protein
MIRTSPRILVVDDNEALLENIAECLEDEGYEVALARDGASALTKLQRDPLPHVVLLDLMMPGMSGRELVEQIRAIPRLSSLRVVLTTGHSLSEVHDVRADAFLAKPFGVDDLLAAIAPARV